MKKRTDIYFSAMRCDNNQHIELIKPGIREDKACYFENLDNLRYLFRFHFIDSKNSYFK
jgi:hypothetical protein